MAERRIVITGMGLVCPVGNNVNDSWANIRAGKSGIDWISLFDADLVENRVAGEVKDIDLTLAHVRASTTKAKQADVGLTSLLFAVPAIRPADRAEIESLTRREWAAGLNVYGINAFQSPFHRGNGCN